MVVFVEVLLRSEVNPPTTYTLSPMYSRSVISPLVMRGMFVRGTSGTNLVWPGTGCAADATPVIPGTSTNVLATTAMMAADRLNFLNIPSSRTCETTRSCRRCSKCTRCPGQCHGADPPPSVGTHGPWDPYDGARVNPRANSRSLVES